MHTNEEIYIDIYQMRHYNEYQQSVELCDSSTHIYWAKPKT